MKQVNVEGIPGVVISELSEVQRFFRGQLPVKVGSINLVLLKPCVGAKILPSITVYDSTMGRHTLISLERMQEDSNRVLGVMEIKSLHFALKDFNVQFLLKAYKMDIEYYQEIVRYCHEYRNMEFKGFPPVMFSIRQVEQVTYFPNGKVQSRTRSIEGKIFGSELPEDEQTAQPTLADLFKDTEGV